MDRDAIREQIIESARRIFARFGFKKTTVDEIARSIHKGKSSIYHYFKSKEEIFACVIEKEYLYLKKSIEKALKNTDSPKDRLKIYILTRLNVLSKLSNFYIALKHDYFEYLGLIEELRARYVQDEIEMIENILQDGMNKRVFEIKNRRITAQTIILALKGLEFTWAMEENQKELKENIGNLLDMFFYGMIRR